MKNETWKKERGINKMYHFLNRTYSSFYLFYVLTFVYIGQIMVAEIGTQRVV